MDWPLPATAPTGSFTAAVLGLTARIEAAWLRTDFSDAAFADIAARALEAEALHARFTLADALRECVTTPLRTPQLDLSARFAQPPVTLFRSSRFHVALLFWDDATTSIHEHGFSGAFCVFSGSSLQVRYAFLPERQVNSRLLIGAIVRRDASVLHCGAVQRIEAGTGGAHALFHLDRPSATLLVRTHADARAQPQMTYHWPCYAMDPFFDDHELVRKCQLLRFAHRIDNALFRDLAADLLAASDFESALRILVDLACLPLDPALALELAVVAARAHPGAGAGLPGLMQAALRERDVLALRCRVTDPDRRLLLAFLLNGLPIGEVRPLLSRLFPDREPAGLIAMWLAALLDECAGVAGSPLTVQAIRLLIDGERLPQASRKLVAGHARLPAAAELGAEELAAAERLLRRLSEVPLLATLLG